MTFRNFEKLGAHLQMKDVYFFMRKILEKNHWSVALADQMIESYAAITPVEHAEYCYLYARFLYPEKFWKVANGYLNRRDVYKRQPCGSRQWEILRVGADFRLKCQGCGHPVSYTHLMIKQGDTLAKICMQYYGSLSKMGEVCERNQIENKDSIYYGPVSYTHLDVYKRR